LVVVEAATRPVALEPVVDVEVLLEVVAQWHVNERSTVGRQLHARGQPGLGDGEVARGEVAVELRYVAAVGDAPSPRQRGPGGPRAPDGDEEQVVDEVARPRR